MNNDYQVHVCDFSNTSGQCSCGARIPEPTDGLTAPGTVFQLTPFILPVMPYPLTETLPYIGPVEFLPEPPIPQPDEDIGPPPNVLPFDPGEAPIEALPLLPGRQYAGEVNGGSPVGPGFVVYERAPGEYGYDCKMARESIGPGWRPLIDILFKRIEWDKQHNPTSGFAHMVVTQVKEKFGGLCIYFHTDDRNNFDQVEGFVDALGAVSYKTCEACGNPALPPNDLRPRGWILSLCRSCDAKDDHELHALFEQTEQAE